MSAQETVKEITAYQVIMGLHKACGKFTSIERAPEKASGSEIRRWFSNKAIEINGLTYAANDPWPPVLKSIVLFPNSVKRRTTLYFDDTIKFIAIQE